MGTRNLTIVQYNGAYKIAQYGQWDGYPECGGIEALTFARKLKDQIFRKRFENNLDKCRFFTDEEIKTIDKKIEEGGFNWQAEYPQLHRDVGRDILDMVYNADGGMVLENSINFASDSLFCEWAWLIDLDKNTFECYEGFNSEPLSPEDRFFDFPIKEYYVTTHNYYPVKKTKEWSLDDLPDDDSFLAEFKKDEEEEDD